MEVEFVRHSRYDCLRSKVSSFFMFALRIHLSGKLHDPNYNNCILERFPTRLFLVLNLVHMPEHPFFPELLAEIGHRRSRATMHALWGVTCMGPIVSGTEALGAEALAIEDALAAEALPQRRRWLQRRRWPHT